MSKGTIVKAPITGQLYETDGRFLKENPNSGYQY